jgi:signal transduction histidine kinase
MRHKTPQGGFREAFPLATCSRSSEVRSVAVTLTTRPHAATQTITDDGRGFAADERQQGVGLSSMRERLAALGGRLAITAGRARAPP